MRTLIAILTIALFATSSVTASHADEDFPNKTIVITNIYAPGGGQDVVARAVAQKLSEKWKVPVIVQSKAGAGGTIAADYVTRQPADGYNLLLTDMSYSVVPSIYRNLSYDPKTGLQPVIMMNTVTQALVINASLPVKTLAELAVYAKKASPTLIYASAGIGSLTQLGMEIYKKDAGVDIRQVTYRGSAPAMSDLISGRANMYMGALASTLPQVKAGTLKVVAVMQKQRAPAAPDVESSVEAGYPNLDFKAYYGLLAPAGTPRPVVDKLATAVREALQTPELQQLLRDLACNTVAAGPDEFAEFLKADFERWRKAAEVAGVGPVN